MLLMPTVHRIFALLRVVRRSNPGAPDVAQTLRSGVPSPGLVRADVLVVYPDRDPVEGEVA